MTDFLQTAMEISGLGSGYACDEDENSYPQPALKQFLNAGPTRSNKAKDDHSNRVKARLYDKVKARIAEKEKGKDAKINDYKTSLPRTVSQAGSQSYEVEGDPRGAPIPDLDPLSPTVTSPVSMQPMDVEMMSPAAGPMVVASENEPATPACAPMLADPFLVTQPQLMDPAQIQMVDSVTAQIQMVDSVTAQGQMVDSVTAQGQMVDITDWANQIQPGHTTQDQNPDPETAHDNQNALTGTDDPMLAMLSLINTSGPEALQDDDGMAELKEKFRVSCIEEELKRSYEETYVQQTRPGPAPQQPYNDYTNGIQPGEGSFLDDIMNAPQPPTEQGGQLEITDKNQWGNGLGGGTFAPAGEWLAFDQYGNRNQLPPLPSFNRTFPNQVQKAPPTPPPLSMPVTVTVPHEGRRHVIPCTLETKIQTVMDRLRDMAGIKDEFFLSTPDMMPVNDQKILDRPGNYKFTVTVLPKPSKPQRRRPAKK